MNEHEKDLLRRLALPLDDESTARVRQRVAEAKAEGEGFVAVWLASRGVCVTGAVLHGQLQNWMMFPAGSAEEAQGVARFLHRLTQSAVDTLSAVHDAAADDVIARAKRH